MHPNHAFRVLVLGLLVVFLVSPLAGLEKKAYKVFVVSDTLGTWAVDIQTGFREQLDKQLASQSAKATYTVFDTKVDPSTIPDILKAIADGEPDLILTCNFPNGFADSQVTAKLAGQPYKIVSLNPIPVENGLIKSWAKPGGNVTGIGVFLQFTSTIKLAQKIQPKLKKVAFGSWSAMGVVNDWFASEMTKAAKETGVELVEFRKFNNNEEEMAFFRDYKAKATDTFVMIGISAFVHKDGSGVDTARDWIPTIQKDLGNLLFVSYDDTTVSLGVPAATAVIWTDIGAQAADKAWTILQGANPGDLPWEYPRKYNLILNLQAAKDRGLTFPPALISSAYRVYTDYKGTYAGQK